MVPHAELESLKKTLRQKYEDGASVWELSVKHTEVSKSWIRTVLDDLIKAKKWARELPPNEAEVAQRVAEIKARWTPEETSRRWVGASRNSREVLQRSASNLLPD